MARKSSVKNTGAKVTEKKPVVKVETVEKKDIKKEAEVPAAKATEKKAATKVTAKAAEKAPEAKKAKEAAPAAKAAEKKVETKEAAKKTDAKTAEKKAETKAAVKKTTTKKKTAEKAPAKPGRKPAAKKAGELNPEVYLQYIGMEVEESEIVDRIKEQYVSEGHRAGNIKSLKIYLKPEEKTAYYVINDKTAGRVALF